MKLLAIDTSSRTASCAIVEDGVLLGEFYTNISLTHSQTALPMVGNLLEQARVSLKEIDCFGVTAGPGSFTGLRIGIAAVKGMAHALGRPCVPVSTLEALAWNFQGIPCTVVPVLDARVSQVYTARFSWEAGSLVRQSPDEAISIADLEERLKKIEKPVFFVGDGADLCYNKLNSRLPCMTAPPAIRYTRAAAVALACEQACFNGQTVSAGALAPAYLRLPQAERERLAREAGTEKE